jgi:DNA-binding NarL/FixJ family response regulator
MLQELAQLNVLLVDDHPAIRSGIRALIADEPDMKLVAEHGSASADTVDAARWADVAVLDYHLGDRDGLWLARQIKRRSATTPVLIYSAFADAHLAVAAIVAGADGLLAKTTLAEELSLAIRWLAQRRQYFPAIPPSVAATLCARLEPVDQAICSMLIHGVPPVEIAERLGLTPLELDERRESILQVIAPRTARTSVLDAARAPLDYDRPRRGRRYPATK